MGAAGRYAGSCASAGVRVNWARATAKQAAPDAGTRTASNAPTAPTRGAGAANPLGGLLGLLALQVGVPTDAEYGVVYSLVAGMMTYISLGELLPSARRYDPDDRVTTKALLAGFAFMSATLVLLAYVGAHD